ncbi:hypothetical protein Pst134EB_020090 [Puccinia striiformis f. sp. tritici]|nr:hypothetical protein Pst134EB_020090 [Puccinia striiformis f. sp. tritici]
MCSRKDCAGGSRIIYAGVEVRPIKLHILDRPIPPFQCFRQSSRLDAYLPIFSPSISPAGLRRYILQSHTKSPTRIVPGHGFSSTTGRPTERSQHPPTPYLDRIPPGL